MDWREKKKAAGLKCVNNDLHVIVGDNGIGIPRKHLETIRKTFETGDFKGIGVGNIYKRIRSNMWKGSMTISSKENMGTIIRIIIPYWKVMLHFQICFLIWIIFTRSSRQIL